MTVNRLVFKCVDSNTYKLCGGETNKFCLMSQKVVYPYERMNSWERFNEKSLTDRKEIYMNLTMFESFRNKCTEIYELGPAYFFQHLD